MKEKRNNFWVEIIVAVCLLALISAAAMAVTPAGTQIQSTGTAKYYSGSGVLMPTATSNTVITTVGRAASVSVSPTSDSKQTERETPADFALTVTNTGNGSDTFDLTVTEQDGSTVAIYGDTNNDGQRQSTETTEVTATGTLAAGGTFKCFVSVQLPSDESITTDTATFTAKSRFDATKTAQSTLTIEEKGPYTSPYIRTWLINGYYSNTDVATRMTKDYIGGEAGVAPLEGSVSGGKTWTKLESATDYIDLAALYGAPIYCAAYTHVYVYTPIARTVSMQMSSDDGIKAWLNGTVVWNNDVRRPYLVDQDKTTINLLQGWNRLLIKITQSTKPWLFAVKLCDASGNAINGLEYALAPDLVDDTLPPVISNVMITPSSTSATVEWDTNEPSSTYVDYGTTTALGMSQDSETLVTHHKATLNGLTANTTYYVKVGGADAKTNIAWDGNYTFKTLVPSTNTNPYILTWLINGYHLNSDRTTRMSRDYIGGEAGVTPKEGSLSAGKTWTKRTSTKEYIDLYNAFGSPTGCAAYSCVYVYSPIARSVGMWMGSDDGIKVWLNGTVVWNNDVYRSMVIDQDKKTVNLAAGWNRLLVKVTQGGSGWGFSLKLCDSTGRLIPDLIYTTSP